MSAFTEPAEWNPVELCFEIMKVSCPIGTTPELAHPVKSTTAAKVIIFIHFSVWKLK